MVNIITIKNDTIPYLDEKNIKAFEDVTLISSEGLTIKINSLLLGAMSHSLKMAFHEADIDEYAITTEFILEELIQIKQFFMTGSCNAMSQSLLRSFGIKIMPFGTLQKKEVCAQLNALEKHFKICYILCIRKPT